MRDTTPTFGEEYERTAVHEAGHAVALAPQPVHATLAVGPDDGMSGGLEVFERVLALRLIAASQRDRWSCTCVARARYRPGLGKHDRCPPQASHLAPSSGARTAL